MSTILILFWLAGAIIGPPAVLASVVLAIYGAFKWRGPRRVAAMVPLLTAACLFGFMSLLDAGNMSPPLYMAIWVLAMLVYGRVMERRFDRESTRPLSAAHARDSL